MIGSVFCTILSVSVAVLGSVVKALRLRSMKRFTESLSRWMCSISAAPRTEPRIIANSAAVIIDKMVIPITTSISVNAVWRLGFCRFVNIDVQGVFLRHTIE